MSDQIVFFAHGVPKGQPRPRAFYRPGRGVRCFDPGTAEGWKSEVAAAARGCLPAAPLDGPLRVELCFYIPRPKDHYRSGKHADDLRDSAPKHHVSTPDLDNLAKAVMDCMTRLGFWRDDSQVTTVTAYKYWSGKQGGGARISVERVTP